MAKNFDDVIVPDRRRSIRDIPIPEGRRKTDRVSRAKKVVPVERAELSDRVEEDNDPPTPPHRHHIPRHRRGRKRFWITTFAILIILGFGVLSMMNGATIAYVPKSATVSYDNEIFTAQKTGTTGLLYSVVKLSRDKGMEAPAGAEQEVSRKASGTIVVYNNAGTEPQRLVENTRFESADGKVYRIAQAISVPGSKTASGVTQPGSLEVMVYADQSGESYNTGLTDFTVPGLKGTPRFETIYARSKTPMAGGFVGMEKTVSNEDLLATKSQVETALKDELVREAEAEVPDDFILFPSLSAFTFEVLPQTPGTGSSVTVNTRGHLYGVMFKKSDFARHVTSKKVKLSSSDILDIPDVDSLSITFAGAPPVDLLPLNEISFKVTGSTVVLWRTDEVALKEDLAGRHKKDVAAILKNYPTIVSATATIKPFWKTTLPEETNKISVRKSP